MSTALMTDNWLLQNVASCLKNGLDNDQASVLVIDQPGDTHVYKDVSAAGMQLEALLSFIGDIVLRDEILVDQGFGEGWLKYKEVFSGLLDSGLLRRVDFLAHESRLTEPREAIVSILCATSSLKEIQKQNELAWAKRREVVDNYTSQVLWGGAGMLSRSHVFEVAYSGHPARRRLFEQVLNPVVRRDVVSETMDWMVTQRLRLFQSHNKVGKFTSVNMALPLVAIDVIHEAADISQLIPIAIQMREKHKKLREWLKAVQMAIDSEDVSAITKYKKTLDAVGRDLDRAMGDKEDRSLSVSIGLTGISVSKKVLNIDNVLKNFGVRAELGKYVFAPQGIGALNKLLFLFGHEKSGLGISALDYLRLFAANNFDVSSG